MALKNYYELLEIDPTASADDVKRAFRLQIARYHPDKVQHLGKEFQQIAVVRAAELTEAYRVLSDANRRAEYDRAREADRAAAAATAVPSAAAPRQAASAAPAVEPAAPPRPPTPQFVQERAIRDEFVRQATLQRFKHALVATIGRGYEESHLKGFELAWQPKTGLFARKKGPRLLGRFVSHIDGPAVADAWAQAGRWGGPSHDDVCVFLIGPSLAPQADLAAAIAEQRRKGRGVKVTLIPINAHDWGAHVPTDAPEVAKTLVARLRSGT